MRTIIEKRQAIRARLDAAYQDKLNSANAVCCPYCHASVPKGETNCLLCGKMLEQLSVYQTYDRFRLDFLVPFLLFDPCFPLELVTRSIAMSSWACCIVDTRAHSVLHQFHTNSINHTTANTIRPNRDRLYSSLLLPFSHHISCYGLCVAVHSIYRLLIFIFDLVQNISLTLLKLITKLLEMKPSTLFHLSHLRKFWYLEILDIFLLHSFHHLIFRSLASIHAILLFVASACHSTHRTTDWPPIATYYLWNQNLPAVESLVHSLFSPLPIADTLDALYESALLVHTAASRHPTCFYLYQRLQPIHQCFWILVMGYPERWVSYLPKWNARALNVYLNEKKENSGSSLEIPGQQEKTSAEDRDHSDSHSSLAMNEKQVDGRS